LISVIVPVLNEEDNIAPLIKEITAAAIHAPITEILYVDDGSTDNTLRILTELRTQYPMLRVICHDRRCGQSAALWAGFQAAKNDIVITLDGDGQNDPADIPLLYELYQKNSPDNPRMMIAGQRKKRQDNLGRRLASRFANGMRSALLKDGTRDTGCSLKLLRRQDYLALPYFNHMHRFLPALMKRNQGTIFHVDVSHRPRQHGASKYGNFSRALVGISDLLGVWWLQQRPYSYPVINEIE
jgi:dolichol-phosphate mannosyltransferase